MVSQDSIILGGLGYLSEQEQMELSSHLEQKLYAHSKDIRRYVIEKYGVDYTVEGLGRLLSRLDFVFKKTKHVLGKGDLEKQLLFEKQYRKLKKKKEAGDEICFMDGVRSLYNSANARG